MYDRHFIERPVVECEARPLNACCVNAFDHRPVGAGGSECAGVDSEGCGIATDIEAVHVNPWRGRENAGHASRARQVCELNGIEASRNRGRLLVNDIRLALDDDAFLQRREVQHDIDGCRKSDPDTNTLTT